MESNNCFMFHIVESMKFLVFFFWSTNCHLQWRKHVNMSYLINFMRLVLCLVKGSTISISFLHFIIAKKKKKFGLQTLRLFISEAKYDYRNEKFLLLSLVFVENSNILIISNLQLLLFDHWWFIVKCVMCTSVYIKVCSTIFILL